MKNVESLVGNGGCMWFWVSDFGSGVGGGWLVGGWCVWFGVIGWFGWMVWWLVVVGWIWCYWWSCGCVGCCDGMCGVWLYWCVGE